MSWHRLADINFYIWWYDGILVAVANHLQEQLQLVAVAVSCIDSHAIMLLEHMFYIYAMLPTGKGVPYLWTKVHMGTGAW